MPAAWGLSRPATSCWRIRPPSSACRNFFGLFPACVLPFLIRRIGVQRAHYLTLMTKPIAVQEAHDWGLVDAHDPDSASLLHRHLLRPRRLSKPGITRDKHYMHDLADILRHAKPLALAANREVFSNPPTSKVFSVLWDRGSSHGKREPRRQSGQAIREQGSVFPGGRRAGWYYSPLESDMRHRQAPDAADTPPFPVWFLGMARLLATLGNHLTHVYLMAFFIAAGYNPLLAASAIGCMWGTSLTGGPQRAFSEGRLMC